VFVSELNARQHQQQRQGIRANGAMTQTMSMSAPQQAHGNVLHFQRGSHN
jgi:hypothetical protein